MDSGLEENACIVHIVTHRDLGEGNDYVVNWTNHTSVTGTAWTGSICTDTGHNTGATTTLLFQEPVSQLIQTRTVAHVCSWLVNCVYTFDRRLDTTLVVIMMEREQAIHQSAKHTI